MAIDGGTVEVRFEGDVTPLRRSVEEAVGAINEFEVAAESADETLKESFGTKAAKGFDEFSNRAGDAFQNVIDKADETVLSVKELGSAMKSVGFGVLTAGATAATGALVSLAQKGIAATDFLETSRVAMAGLTGSIEEGNKAMSLAANYWQNNPFQRIDVTNATKQLVQFGRTTDQISGDLDILGNVSLSTGMDIAQLARYYARVSASGRAMTIDLEMMSDRGVPIYRELAKALGTTTAGVREMASKGKIDFETFKKAMEGAVNPEAMEAYENTLARQTDRFKGSIQILAGELAGYKIINDELVISEQGLEKAWMRLIKALATGLRSEGMRKGLEGIGNALAKIVDKITTLVEPAFNMLSKVLQFIGDNSSLLLPILGAVGVALGSIASKLPMVGGLVSSLTGPISKVLSVATKLVTLNPALGIFVGIFGAGLFNAIKNSEQFRNTLGSIFKSLSQILENLMQAVQGILEVFGELISTLASSGIVQGILQGIASALAWIAQVIASIPPEMLATLISFFLSLKLLKANPLYLLAAGLAILISRIKELGGIGKVLEKLPETLGTIGHNMMTGLINGIQEGARKVFDYVKSIARTIVSTFKNMLGIHSPSTVMYGLGQDVVLGLANGIEDSSDAVQVAMNNLAKDILSLSEKVIKNKVDFGILDIKGEYQQWKKVAKLFTVGSEQYNYAIEKMEEARKQANLQILNLQQSYNNALDETIDKIANMYGLLDDVNLKAGKNAQQILKGLDQQVAKLSEWAEAQEVIANSKLDAGLIEELQAMGVESTSELSAIANMTADELSTLNNMWLKKQEIANRAGIKQMEGLKNDTLDQINSLKKGIDGVTVDVEDVGGRLVSSISEGVYGAIPTLESAFSQLGSYIEKARRELAKSASGTGTGKGLGGTDTPDAGDEIAKTLKEDIENGIGKLKDMLPNILLGAVAAWGALKIGPKILKAIASKLLGGGILSQGLSGLFSAASEGMLSKQGLSQFLNLIDTKDDGFLAKAIAKIQTKLEKPVAEASEQMAKSAKTMKKTTVPAETIAQSSTSVGSSMQTAGKGMSKVNSVLNTIIKGAVAVTAIAVAIAAMAGALWLTYNALKNVNWGELAIDLAAMAATIVVFGAVAFAIEKLVGIKGVLVIVGLAIDIAAVAVACRIAYEALKPVQWGDFGRVLGEMAAAIAVFGVFAGILGMGPVAAAEALGLIVIAGIALDLVALSKACREAYDTMKDVSWNNFGNMLGQMAAALGVMGGFSAILGPLVGLEALGWVSITLICDELVKVSKALKYVDQNVPEDFGSLSKKLEHIKTALEKINWMDLGTVIGMMVTSWSAEPAERIVAMYVKVAEALNKLSKIELDKEKIEANLDYIKSTLEGIKAKTDLISGWLEASRLDIEASSVENAGRIVLVYGEMVDALDKLANFEPDEKGISKSLVTMAGVITLLRNQSYGPSGIFNIFNNMNTIANDVDKIKDIVKYYLEMVPTIQDLGKSENQISNSLVTKVTKNINNIKQIVLAIGSVDTGGWIEQKENDIRLIQSMINKFTEIIPVANQVKNMDFNKEDIKNKIGDVKEIIKEIGSVRAQGNLADKEWAVGMASSIAWKMAQFAEATRNIGEVDSGAVNKIVLSMYTVLNSVATSLNEKIVVFENVGVNMGKAIAHGAGMQTIQMQQAGIKLQSSLWSAIESKMGDEFKQGAWMATQFGNGLKSVSFDNIGAQMQTSLWWGIQNRMNDEYQQGRAMGKQFRQGLYDVDYGNAGWWAVQGFINGANSRGYSGDGVYHTGWWIADTFLKGLKNRGGQGSPWKTTMQSGNWAIEGLIEGMQEQETALVGEATSLADQVIDALSMDGLTMSPSLDASVNGNIAPSMDSGEYGTMGSSKNVVVNQEINAYTPVDMDVISKNLSWDLAKI